jgi:hypothetical protein
MFKRLVLIAAVLTAACSSTPGSTKPAAVADMPAVNTDRILTDIRKLSSDEFEATRIERRKVTVAYLTEQ